MPTGSGWFLLGILSLMQCRELPPLYAAAVPLIPLLVAWRRPWCQYVLWYACGFSWALIICRGILSTGLPPSLEGVDLRVTGRVVSLPDTRDRSTRFELRVHTLKVPGGDAVVEAVAIGSDEAYRSALQEMARQHEDHPETVYERLAFEDIRMAADQMLPVYRQTDGRDGFVSIEVAPGHALDTDATVRHGETKTGSVTVSSSTPAQSQSFAVAQLSTFSPKLSAPTPPTIASVT